MTTQVYPNGSIKTTVTGKELGDESQITVLRKVVKYEELVFDNEDDFNKWKNLAINDEWGEFNEFTKRNFVDIWYQDVNEEYYVALMHDQTMASDDWISSGIFEEGVDPFSFNDMEIQ